MKLLGLKKTAERVPPEIDDVMRLYAVAERDESRRPFAIPVFLAISCAMRLGEVLGLRWSNVDLDAAELHVREALDGTTMTIKKPKTKDGVRRINLDADTVTALREHRKRQREWALACGPGYDRDADLVCPGPNGKPWKTNYFSRSYTKFAKSLGVTGTYHDLRHASASYLGSCEEGVDPRTIANRLGHSDPTFTMTRYCHSGQKEDRRAAQVMATACAPRPNGGTMISRTRMGPTRRHRKPGV